jgi:hypothetical protein
VGKKQKGNDVASALYHDDHRQGHHHRGELGRMGGVGEMANPVSDRMFSNPFLRQWKTSSRRQSFPMATCRYRGSTASYPTPPTDLYWGLLRSGCTCRSGPVRFSAPQYGQRVGCLCYFPHALGGNVFLKNCSSDH